MTGKYLVIYDSDLVYAKRLQQFLCERESNYFEILSFSEKEELETGCYKTGNIKTEILLGLPSLSRRPSVKSGIFASQIS